MMSYIKFYAIDIQMIDFFKVSRPPRIVSRTCLTITIHKFVVKCFFMFQCMHTVLGISGLGPLIWRSLGQRLCPINLLLSLQVSPTRIRSPLETEVYTVCSETQILK